MPTCGWMRGHDLDGGGAGADHRDALAARSTSWCQRAVWKAGPSKRLGAGDRRDRRLAEPAHAGDEDARGERAAAGLDPSSAAPSSSQAASRRRSCPCARSGRTPKSSATCLQVGADLRLQRERLRPLGVRRERERVEVRRHVALAAGVGVLAATCRRRRRRARARRSPSRPACFSLIAMPRPAKPLPTIATSTWSGRAVSVSVSASWRSVSLSVGAYRPGDARRNISVFYCTMSFLRAGTAPGAARRDALRRRQARSPRRHRAPLAPPRPPRRRPRGRARLAARPAAGGDGAVRRRAAATRRRPSRR